MPDGINGYDHRAEFRRCLLEVDVSQIRRLWQHLSPHLPQPKSEDECLETIHRARIEMRNCPEHLKQYSREWVAERERRRIAHAVGIAVGMHSDTAPHRQQQHLGVRHEMEHAVSDAHQGGVDLDKDASEVTRRIRLAWRRAWGLGWARNP